MKGCPVRIYPGFFLSVAVALLFVPIRWVVAWIIAATVHETGHLIALRICRCPIYSVKIGAYGAKIEADMASGIKMTFCALAGPLGGLMLLFVLRIAPRIALCGLFQSVYNLIPISPLDGSNALTGILGAVLGSQRGNVIAKIIEAIFILVLFFAAIYAFFYLELGIFPVLIAGFILFRSKNIPCKPGLLRVQYP